MHRRLILLCLIVPLLLSGCATAVGQASGVEPTGPPPTPAQVEPPETQVPTPTPTAAVTATAAATVTPPAAPTQSARTAAGTYCLWPGESFGAVADAAQVDLAELEALNPNASQFAGSTIRLPASGLPPERWERPTPQIDGPEDLPFGNSGYYLGADNRHKRVALTFDIGYVPENTERMVWLREQGISATFFVLGISVSRHPEVVKDVLANGHTLGSHSWDHLNFQDLSLDEINEQLQKTQQAILAADDTATIPYFRAPFGAIDVRVQDIAYQMGYPIIGWTVDSQDWVEGATAELVYRQVTRQVCPGAILLMHDASPANIDALPRIIDFLRANQYEIVPLGELLGF